MAYVKWILSGVLFSVLAAFLHFSLPQRDIVRIVDTEVKREDEKITNPDGSIVIDTRDVRLINAVGTDGNPRVYRNEDTGLWPPYFKFDSANLAARAEDARSTRDAPRWVVLRHYGWRFEFVSMFPNALSIRDAEGAEEQLIPWFNIVAVLLLLLGAVLIRRLMILMFERHIEPVIDSVDQTWDEASETAGRLARRKVGFIRGIWQRLTGSGR